MHPGGRSWCNKLLANCFFARANIPQETSPPSLKSVRYRTIRSHGCGAAPRVNYVSNPDVNYLNNPTGTDTEDNSHRDSGYGCPSCAVSRALATAPVALAAVGASTPWGEARYGAGPDNSVTWFADRGAMEHVTPESVGMFNGCPAPPGTLTAVGHCKGVPVEMIGDLELAISQLGGEKIITMYNVSHAPEMGSNFISLQRLITQCKEPVTLYRCVAAFRDSRPAEARIRLTWDHPVCTRGRLADTKQCLQWRSCRGPPLAGTSWTCTVFLVVQARPLCRTPLRSRVKLSGDQGPCVGCSKAKAQPHAVPAITDRHATRKRGRLFVYLDGPLHAESLRESGYVAIFVDDFTLYKVITSMKNISDAIEGLKSFTADLIVPRELRWDDHSI